MSNLDVIAMALKNLFKRKLRTCLTILGVIIGTASIVVMVSLGLAVNKNFEQEMLQYSEMTTIHVTGVDSSSSEQQQKSKKVKMDDTAIYNFKNLDGVEAVSPVDSVYSIKAVTGKYSARLEIIGIEPEFLKKLGYELEAGRFLEDGDKFSIFCGGKVPFSFQKNSKRRYYYYGDDTEKDKKPDVDVMKERIKISVDSNYGEKKNTSTESSGSSNTKKAEPHDVKFVGIIKQTDSNAYNESDRSCYMPIEQVKKLKAEQKKFDKNLSRYMSNDDESGGYNQIYVKCKDVNAVKDVAKKIKDMGYYEYYQGQWLESMQKTAANMQALLGAIGGVSLFVAAIGIANTMIMSVYERTREIGIMKVIGASIRDIKKIFLVEASTIGFLGGILGACFSLFVSYVLNKTNISFFDNDYMPIDSIEEKPAVSLIPMWLCLAATIFAGFVGLLSGYLPARRATKLSALSAIKTE